jgi:hypothetical protein
MYINETKMKQTEETKRTKGLITINKMLKGTSNHDVESARIELTVNIRLSSCVFRFLLLGTCNLLCTYNIGTREFRTAPVGR